MADAFEFDFSEINKLSADLGDVPARMHRNVEKAVEVTARNVKDDWRPDADRTGLHGYAAAIDYDMTSTDGEVSADIGPNLDRGGQASMGFVEEGGSDVFSAPQHAGRDALKANEADFVRGLLIAATDAIEDVT